MRAWLICMVMGVCSCDGGDEGPFAPPELAFRDWRLWIAPNAEDDLDDVRPGGELAIDDGEYDAAKEEWSGTAELELEYYVRAVDVTGQHDKFDRHGAVVRERAGTILFEGTWTWAARDTTTRMWFGFHCTELDIESDRADLQDLDCASVSDLEVRCRVVPYEEAISCGFGDNELVPLEPI